MTTYMTLYSVVRVINLTMANLIMLASLATALCVQISGSYDLVTMCMEYVTVIRACTCGSTTPLGGGLLWEWGCSSVVERLLCMQKVLGSKPSISNQLLFIFFIFILSLNSLIKKSRSFFHLVRYTCTCI